MMFEFHDTPLIIILLPGLLFHEPSDYVCVRFLLLRIIQLQERFRHPPPRKRIFQKIIADMRILRKQRAMEIGPDHILIQRALLAVLAVVAEPAHNLSERPDALSEMRSSSVILKPCDRIRKQRILKHNI